MKLHLEAAMTLEDALGIVDTAIVRHRKTHLSDLERAVFQGSWEKLTYLEMVEKFSWSEPTLKDAGVNLWKLLSEALEESVKKTNLKSVLERHQPARVVQQD